MQINVDIKNVSIENKGKYKVAQVTFEEDGKEKTRPVMSFGKTEKTFLFLADRPTGPHNVILEQDGKYWNWVKIEKSKGGVIAAGAAQSTRSYESVEEREARQRYIVRQSSLSTAVAYHTLVGSKKVSESDIIKTASVFEDYVFGEYTPDLERTQEFPDIPI